MMYVFWGYQKVKARRGNFGLCTRAPQRVGKLQRVDYFYHGFWLFARLEAYLFCCCLRFDVVGVLLFSSFVVAAGGGRPIVVMNAVFSEGSEIVVKRRGDTVKPLKGRKAIVKRRTVVGTV
jgi:hypothetical protein